jgi:carboxyl-terminal processing protease
METNPRRFNPFIPFFIGISIAFGVLIGYFLTGGGNQNNRYSISGKSDKLRDVLNYISKEYVDTLNAAKLEEDAIVSLLQQLDPHSAYIPAQDLSAVSEQLEGNFDGIGVEFNIQKDTIMVVAAITGGPSESLGIQSGDRIVSIEGKVVAGKGIKNEDVIKKLRGKRGTKVNVGIYRPGQKGIRPYTITRGQIPIYSVDASYMVNDKTGYIKISRFAATTYDEYLKAFNQLKMNGMLNLILDLRDNPGGYLNTAVDLCDEFLSNGKKIVYTEGKARKHEDFKATARGGFETGNLAVLIDEGSASASEIVSGAVQDNDRGWIIGRRSFGKGLVQEEVKFQDGSAMRLTIARYYTPTGRCIQKPYEKGTDAYYHELLDRYDRGEMTQSDSTKFSDSVSYKTPSGRIVFGGGGIMPDVFVPADTGNYSPYLADIVSQGLMNRFAFGFTDGRRKELLSRYKNPQQFSRSFPVETVMGSFYDFVEKNGVKINDAGKSKSSRLLKEQLPALIARVLFGNSGFYTLINEHDPAMRKAIELVQSNKLVSNTRFGNGHKKF